MDDDDLFALTLPEHGTGERARRRQEREHHAARKARMRKSAIVVVMIVLAAAVPVLGYIGFHALLTSTAGRKLDAVTDPTKPGYEANVAPTPVEVIAQIDADQQLTALTVLALGAKDAGGAVLFVPVTTTAPAPSASDASSGISAGAASTSSSANGGSGASTSSSASAPSAAAPATLAATYGAGGADALGPAVSRLLGIGFDELTVLDDARWAELTKPVAPLSLVNPDRLRQPVFPAGPIQLDAASVGPYLAARVSGETEVARLVRHEALWGAWLKAVGASSDPGVVPGESTTGVGRFVRGLAKGSVEIATLPVGVAGAGGALEPDRAAMAAQIARLVPFPTGAIGSARVRVRVLDGVGVSGLAITAARLLVPSGAEIAIIGNADHFGYDVTAVRYNDDAKLAAAQTARDALGVGRLEQGTILDDVVDVTVVVGKDFAAQYGSGTSTTSTTVTGETSSG